MGDSVRLFSIRSDDYAQYRPTYPDPLFAWLTRQAPRTRIAVDVACGTGQATIPLLGRFAQVLAFDASVDQLGGATGWGDAQRIAAHADRLPLRDGVADLMVIAQALHWFATPSFFAEARRVLAPDGLFCAWCYSLPRIDSALDECIDRFHGDTLGSYWPAGRASVDAGYRDIHPPFVPLTPPDFAIEAHWSLDQLLGYLRTWSAVKEWQRVQGRDPVAEWETEFTQRWGLPASRRPIRWPLHFIAGYPGRQEPPCTTNCWP